MFENMLYNIIAIVIIVILLGVSILKKVGKLIIYGLLAAIIILIILPILGINFF
ncbi:MAG: hypothetical protein IH845_01555 [Nanoarchaeota archaeon]|nr:hypothetical protein [Nanoarchaeota archaeon]